MPEKPQTTIDVTEGELVAFAETVIRYTKRRFNSARIAEFGLLVSLLGKLTKHHYD